MSEKYHCPPTHPLYDHRPDLFPHQLRLTPQLPSLSLRLSAPPARGAVDAEAQERSQEP